MALTQRLQIRQSQALVMTPQLMQAIKLLQLSNLDLVTYVEAELERNPLLDRGAEEERGPTETEGFDGPERPSADGEAWNAEPAEPQQSPAEDAIDARREDMFPDDPEVSPPRAADGPAGYSEWAGVGPGGREDGEYNLEAFVPSETTLADRLREQLTLAIANPAQRMIGSTRPAMSAAISSRSPKSSAPAWRKSGPCSAFCRVSIRPVSARATSPNA
jgi:RNA polymerase sigma-54 factor